jgi:hypothetical protein
MLWLTQALIPNLHDAACIVKISRAEGGVPLEEGVASMGATRAPSHREPNGY